MTIDDAVRRLLVRICSAETIARVVDPTLADLRFERGRPAWLGYLSLVRALALHAIVSAPGAVASAWRDDERALPRALAAWALVAVMLAAPLVAVPARSALRISWYVVVLLAPQALALALPMSLLVAIPLAFRKAANRGRLLMRGLLLSAICAAATLGVMIEMIPGANQAFRVEMMRQLEPGHVDVTLTPGPIEMTLQQLQEQIQVLGLPADRLTPEAMATIRQLQYTYQLKLALSAISLPLGLLAMSITVAARGRARSLAIGTASAFGYVYGIHALDSWTVMLLKRSDAVPPAVLAWAPAILIAALAATLFWKSRITMTSPCA